MLSDLEKLSACNICLIAIYLQACNACAFQTGWTGLKALVLNVPPDPYRSVSEDPLATVDDWATHPTDKDDWREKRAQEWRDFLARMNSPEAVERRGTKLTSYGWR